MKTNLEKYQKDLDGLISKGEHLDLYLLYELGEINKKNYKNIDDKILEKISKHSFKKEYHGWYNEALALIKQIYPDRLEDFMSFYKIEKRKDLTCETYTISDYMIGLVKQNSLGEIILPVSTVYVKFQQQCYILASIKDRFNSSLYDIKQLLQADVFDSEIDSAKELCKKGFYRAAGAICGVVIEKHLNEVCTQHQIKVTKKNPGINDYNELLKSNNAIDIPAWRNIQRLADLRNMCDHHKDIEPTKDNIEELIAGTDKILKTIF
ncbi:MAG: hypothetical protein E7065_10230 [Lentimicrobiaceae bacterium]|nr:hypothetical protein [Lentimicrobiaceae bacterium]